MPKSMHWKLMYQPHSAGFHWSIQEWYDFPETDRWDTIGRFRARLDAADFLDMKYAIGTWKP